MSKHTTNYTASSCVSGRCLFLLVLAVCLPVSRSDCVAQGNSYTSRSDFNAALTSSSIITFEELPPSGFSSVGTSPVSTHGVTFSNVEHRLFITSPNIIYPMAGAGQYLWNFDSSYPVAIFLPSGTTAFGADFSGGIQPEQTFNATLTAVLEGGQSYSYNFSGLRDSWTFFGITVPEPIVSIIYSDGGRFEPFGTHEEMLDNVSFGTVTTIPEPSTSFIVLLGFVMVFWSRRGGPASSVEDRKA
jgi:hypothetical protein